MASKKPTDTPLTAQILRRLLDYQPDTGRMLDPWGAELGAAHRGRWVVGGLNGRRYYRYRLAWLWMTGEWPRWVIDHIDGDSLNDRWSNLRDVPQRLNMQNIVRPQAHNTSGYLGVTWNARARKWQAQLTVDQKHVHAGYADSPEAAHQMYLDAKRRLHPGCTL